MNMRICAEKDLVYCFTCSLFPTGPGHEYRNKDAAFVAGTRNWHKMLSKGVKPGMLVIHFQSNGHKASVGDLISSVARYKPFPYLVDKKKLKRNIESEKEKERGRCIKRMLLDITTTQGKQGLVFCGKDHEGGNYVELANLLSRHNTEMNQWIGVRYVDVKEAAKERLLTVIDSESKKGVDFSEETMQAMRKLGINEDNWHFNAMILPATRVALLREHRLIFPRTSEEMFRTSGASPTEGTL
ncbi:hypothetical protein QYM36_019036 [Artemia franciscana]|uniref:Uncharacterized protein n=1 Tax=Artemia franciscana TaxID=6661 RepID=A0AA88H1N7_ARTSF|nr:hypothetical protein QYM36_019036 [Artemia franciscana]